MNTYEFTLVLKGPQRIDEDIANKLFESGCDDALPGGRYGVDTIEFDREANSFREAVMSAKLGVEHADERLRVCRVEPSNLVTMAEIGRRSERSRANIRQMVIGERGPGGFPRPISGVLSKSPLWSWVQVAEWLAKLDVIKEEAVEQAREIVQINQEMREHRAFTEMVGQQSSIIVRGNSNIVSKVTTEVTEGEADYFCRYVPINER